MESEKSKGRISKKEIFFCEGGNRSGTLLRTGVKGKRVHGLKHRSAEEEGIHWGRGAASCSATMNTGSCILAQRASTM
jgi:hypothetical protein